MELTQEFRRVFVVFFAWLEKLGICFRDLMSVSWRLQGFLEARKAHNYERIIMLIEMISNGGLTKLLLLPDDAFCGLMHVLNHIQPGLNTTFRVGFGMQGLGLIERGLNTTLRASSVCMCICIYACNVKMTVHIRMQTHSAMHPCRLDFLSNVTRLAVRRCGWGAFHAVRCGPVYSGDCGSAARDVYDRQDRGRGSDRSTP